MGVQANDQQPNNVNEEEIIEQQPKNGEQPKPSERPAGDSGERRAEGATAAEVKSLYEDLGIKAPIPTGATKGRPKASGSGAEKTSKQNDASGAAGKGQANADGSDKSKTASASGENGSDGGAADSKGSQNGASSGKNGQENRKVSGNGDDDEEGIHEDESRNNGAAAKTGEGGSEQEPSGDGQSASDSEGASEGEEDDGEGGKRPGKSNPAVEQRFQKLTTDLKERDAEIERLNQELQKNTQAQAQAKVAEQDPEYKVEDFRRVRDNKTGEIIELDDEKAELAWRRWKDGYDQRASERQAEINRQASLAQRETEITNRIMTESVQAYDTLSSLMEEFPELVKTSGQFDEDFAIEAMPIVQEAIEYFPGTEPGNEAGNAPVIVGLRVDPRKILNALKKVSNKKRALPLNGVNDNVESRSNVAVPHSRSSDPTVEAANDLYKQLGINKRI